MRKRTIALLSVLLTLVMLLSGCEFGFENNPVSKPSRPVDGTGVTDPNGVIDENPYTAVITYNGEIYIPTAEDPITVRWSDDFSVHEASIGPDGVAKIGGLDGDYRVTLEGMPDGFVYDPNKYTADNENRHVRIELEPIIPTTGKGLDPYNAIKINSTGIYCIEVKQEGQETYFEYTPRQNGVYSVDSWMDTAANNINPVGTYWGASPAYKILRSTHDNGGPEGSYTKNFHMEVKIANENISSTGGGSSAFTFGVSATAKDGKYPIKVYIAIKRDGDFSYEFSPAPIIIPKEIPLDANGNVIKLPMPSGTFHWAETNIRGQYGTSAVFEGSKYKLWPKSQGGDGYYHRFDPAKYPSTGGYGPVLYAKVSQPCRFLDLSFDHIEDPGNKALTVSNGTENYKLFIQGWEALNIQDADPVTGKPGYFCYRYCPCREGNCASIAITGKPGTCLPGCPNCDIHCRQLPAEGIGAKGYVDFCNEDGCAPVTQELKEFLQKLSISQLYFMDGQGYVETHPIYSIYAAEADQWLFACGYYE